MSPPTCPRSWEAEALQDGRLVGNEGVLFRRHASVCPTCREEIAAWAALLSAMQRLGPVTTTPFEHHAKRTLLLRLANDKLVGKTAPWARRLGIWIPVAAVFFAVLGASAWWSHRQTGRSERPAVAAASATGPVFEVTPIEGATWFDRSEGPLGRVVLERGTAAVHVVHLVAGQRFLLTLPDGEIEVYGTRFLVDVEHERTKRVEVTDGVVSLRIRGLEERRLDAGERWTDAQGAAASPVAPTASPTAAAANLATAETGGSKGPTRRKVLPEMPDRPSIAQVLGGDPFPPSPTTPKNRHTLKGRGGVLSPAASLRPGLQPLAPVSTPAGRVMTRDMGGRFAGAVDALEAGDWGRADTLLAAFAAEYPSDARSEDALFLRAVARVRAGDSRAAASLARAYLARYPKGLRRIEAERMIKDAFDR